MSTERKETPYSLQCKEASEACTQEQRRSFVTLMRGGMKLGEAAAKSDMNMEAALGTMNANILTVRILKEPKDVL